MRNAFLNALPVIANALGDSLGVKVVMGANSACTDGKSIFLPSLDADKPESRALGLGFITHEAAHVRFTDFTLTPNTPLEKKITNILEDIRIEKLIARMYPGCKLYLEETVEALVKTAFFAPLKGDETPTVMMQQYMLHQLRLNVLGQEGIADIAKQAEDLLIEKIPAGMRVRLEALMYQVEDCQNTQEVLDLSRSIIKMMEEEAKKEEEKENQKKPGDSDQSQQSQDKNSQKNQEPSGHQQQDGQSDHGEDDGQADASPQDASSCQAIATGNGRARCFSAVRPGNARRPACH